MTIPSRSCKAKWSCSQSKIGPEGLAVCFHRSQPKQLSVKRKNLQEGKKHLLDIYFTCIIYFLYNTLILTIWKYLWECSPPHWLIFSGQGGERMCSTLRHRDFLWDFANRALGRIGSQTATFVTLDSNQLSYSLVLGGKKKSSDENEFILRFGTGAL